MDNSTATPPVRKPQKKTPDNPWVARGIECAVILVAVLIGIMVRLGVYETAIVISGSMKPTMQIDDRVVVDHRQSLRNQWERGDIVIFNPSGSWGDEKDGALTKRIIGLPGETITINDGQVYVNGKPLDEPYKAQEAPEPEAPTQITVPDGQYFVMGDNRNNSEDSRVNGPIREQDIKGRAVFRIYPFTNFGIIPHPLYDGL